MTKMDILDPTLMIINSFGYILSGFYYFFFIIIAIVIVQAKGMQKWYFLVSNSVKKNKYEVRILTLSIINI